MTDHEPAPVDRNNEAERTKISDPDAAALARVCANVADHEQGRDVVVLSVGDLLAITEYFVVVSAGNRRLVRTIVDRVEQGAKEQLGRSPRRTEGLGEQQWVLVDYGDVVVHVFLDEIRQFYDIERLYTDVPRLDWREPGSSDADVDTDADIDTGE